MEELLALLGFSAGASLTIGAVRLLRRGVRATAIELTRAGLRTGDTLRRVGSEARRIGDEARAELTGEQAEAIRPRRRPQARRGEKIQKIEIATQ